MAPTDAHLKAESFRDDSVALGVTNSWNLGDRQSVMTFPETINPALNNSCEGSNETKPTVQ